MKRFFAITVLCLVVTGSMVAAPVQHQRTATRPFTAIIAAAIRMAGRFGFIPTSDELHPPIPSPASKRTTCCK